MSNGFGFTKLDTPFGSGSASGNDDQSPWNPKAATTGTASWFNASTRCTTQPTFSNSATTVPTTSTSSIFTGFTNGSRATGSKQATNSNRLCFNNNNTTTLANNRTVVPGNNGSKELLPASSVAFPGAVNNTAQREQKSFTTNSFFSVPSSNNDGSQWSDKQTATNISFQSPCNPFLNPSSSLASEPSASFKFSGSTQHQISHAATKHFSFSNKSSQALIAEGLGKLNKASQLFFPGLSPSRDRCREIETLLTDSFMLCCNAIHQYFFEEGSPSPVALYNLACVYSLALELQLSLSPTHNSLQDLVNCFGDTPIEQLQRDGFFVAPRVASRESSLTAKTLRDVIQQRTAACDRCIKAAVAIGWNDIQHLRADRDLRLYLTSADTSWLHSKV